MATYKDDLDILKAAEKDSNKLSLNAITELDNKGQLGMYGGGSGKAIPDAFGLMLYVPSIEPVPTPEELPSTSTYYEMEYITKDYEYVKAAYEQRETIRVTAITDGGGRICAFNTCTPHHSGIDQVFEIVFDVQSNQSFMFFPNGKAYLLNNEGGR